MKKLSLIDTSTGEILEGVPVIVGRSKRPTLYGNRWLQMAQDPLLALATDRELWGRPRAVLDYLLGILDFENFVEVHHQAIADTLSLHRPDVTKAISLLVKKGILIKGPSVGRSNSYRLNPAYGWKGDNKKAQEYQLELIKGGRE
jgi:hypothetical protein